MGTLVYDPFYVEMPAFFGMTLDELIAAKTPGAWVEFELGRIDEHAFLDRFFRDGRPVDRPGFLRCVRDAYRLIDGVERILAELKLAGVEMHALSNYSCWYRMIEERTRLSRFLYWSFVSCDLGVRKPDPASFRLPVKRLGVEPDRVLFVDDREQNCAVAREVGLDAIRFEGAAALRRELVVRGLLSPEP